MAPKALFTIAIASVLFLSIFSEVGADGSARSPVSESLGRTFTATEKMARDVANSAAPKAAIVGQAVTDTAKSAANAAAPTADQVGQTIKGTAKSAADSIAPVVDKARDAAKETTSSLGSCFEDKLENLGIVNDNLRNPWDRPERLPTKPPGSYGEIACDAVEAAHCQATRRPEGWSR